MLKETWGLTSYGALIGCCAKVNDVGGWYEVPNWNGWTVDEVRLKVGWVDGAKLVIG